MKTIRLFLLAGIATALLTSTLFAQSVPDAPASATATNAAPALVAPATVQAIAQLLHINPLVLVGLVPLLPFLCRFVKSLAAGDGFLGAIKAFFIGSAHSNKASLLAALLLPVMIFGTGCGSIGSPVPANRIVIHAPSGDYKIETPKNVGIDHFDASVTSNGLFTVKFDKWTSTNDPQVIDKSYAGQAAVTKEFFTGINGLLQNVAEGGVKGLKGGASIRPPLRDPNTDVVLH